MGETTLKDFADRYGPALALVLVLIVLVNVLPSNTKGGGSAASDTGTEVSADGTAASVDGTTAADGTTAGAAGVDATGGTGPAAGGAGPGTVSGVAGQTGGAAVAGAAGLVAGQTVPGVTGAFPCRPDGRQFAVAFSTPPCAQYDKARGNGGATARGVTATQVRMAFWVPKPNAATQAALKAAGAGDEQSDIDRVMEVYRRYFNAHIQTYGREVTFTKVDASGDAADDVAMKADAKRIASQGFFGVLTTGTSGSPTFDATINGLGLLCIGCTVSQSNSFYARTKGLNFAALPSVRDYYSHLGEYFGKRLKGKNAKHAGVNVPDLAGQPRKLGLIWINATMGTVDPGAQEERDNFIKVIAPRFGITGIVDANYNYDIGQGPTTAQTVIAKMNNSRVTTIAMIADPLMPVFFTREATKQGYFPEWLQTGTALTDTSFFGRTYDQQQWAHSFGFSPLWVFWENLQVSDGYREYHHMCKSVMPADQCVEKKESVGVNTYRSPVSATFIGISGAGPNLTTASFAKGMYDYPPTGGFAHLPLLDYTPDSPTAIKDFVEVFWDSRRTGKDEVNNVAAGILLKVAAGKRYKLGSWPPSDPVVFTNGGGEVFTSDKPYVDKVTAKVHEQDGHKHDGKQRCLSC